MTITRTAGPLVDLDQLARSQRGLITRAQVLECGHTDADVRRAIRRRTWQRVLPGLYGTFTGTLTLEQRRHAAYLFGGPQSQIAGVAACAGTACSISRLISASTCSCRTRSSVRPTVSYGYSAPATLIRPPARS